MADLIKSGIGQLHHNSALIQEMIKQTEDFYGLIADRLPELEGDVDQAIKETELLISFFIDTTTKQQKGSEEKRFQLAHILEGIEQKINNLSLSRSSRVEIQHRVEGFLGDASSNNLAKLAQILELIRELNSSLHELKVLSINASIFSFKSGEQGAAFRVITGEINKIANQVKGRHQVIEAAVGILRKWHQDFTAKLHKLLSLDDKIAEQYQGNTEELFTKVLNLLQGSAERFEDLLKEIKESVEPLYQIIILIQEQDIIRQNMENLLRITDKTSKKILLLEQAEDPERQLDLLTFLVESCKLSARLSENINHQLDDSLSVLKGHFDKMDKELKGIISTRELFKSFLGSKSKQDIDGQLTLNLIFQDLLQFVPEFKENLIILESGYQQILQGEDDFRTNLQTIRDGFRGVNSITEQIENLKTLARIELVRMKQENMFINNIKPAIDNFMDSSKQNWQASQALSNELLAEYKQLLELSKKNNELTKQSIKDMEGSAKELLRTKQLIKETVHKLQESLPELMREILNISQELTNYCNIQKMGRALVDGFSQVRDQAAKARDELLRDQDKDNWVGSKELEDLVEEFTSYLERQAAQEEIAELEIDVGSSGGELVLF